MTSIQALSIAGSDSGGGAGIQADIKTFQMRGVFATTALTAVTAQNTLGVSAIHQLPPDIIDAQIHAVAGDFQIRACKIGMLGDAASINTVAQALRRYDLGRVVVDPVMIAKGGAPLLQSDAVAALREQLLPLADVLTPNLPEAEALCGIAVHDDDSAWRAAQALQRMGAKNVVIKGGHWQNSGSAVCRDWVLLDGERFVLDAPRTPTAQTHGTGCTFSACIAAELAKGNSTAAAVRTAKAFISAAIARPLNIGSGHGPTNHWAYGAAQ